MLELPAFEDNPFLIARSSCLHDVQIAKDVTIDQNAMNRFIAQLDSKAVACVAEGSMGENCDTVRGDFHSGDTAANFALTFCLLQFGHGYRYALHQHCQRGASKTITIISFIHASIAVPASELTMANFTYHPPVGLDESHLMMYMCGVYIMEAQYDTNSNISD